MITCWQALLLSSATVEPTLIITLQLVFDTGPVIWMPSITSSIGVMSTNMLQLSFCIMYTAPYLQYERQLIIQREARRKEEAASKKAEAHH